ncbi:MAG: sugar transferase [Candidatus Nanopelagicales bacterium]|nr:sugar transferase [Candidatus Nanopelagicales bacterium]
MPRVLNRFYRVFIKRICDLFFSSLLMILLSPVFFLVQFRVAKNLGRPTIFRQLRPGLRGQVFELRKFRTMVHADPQSSLTDAERLTPFGMKLRSSSLDELPELWNIWRGDMSFVGPRPLLVEYLPLYSSSQAHRHDVRPGLTGWAQINGRNSLSWEKRFELDVWYVENCAFLLDLKILWRTVVKVLKREGITAEGDVTMPPFLG